MQILLAMTCEIPTMQQADGQLPLTIPTSGIKTTRLSCELVKLSKPWYLNVHIIVVCSSRCSFHAAKTDRSLRRRLTQTMGAQGFKARKDVKALPREKRRIGALPTACLGPRRLAKTRLQCQQHIGPATRVVQCPTYGWVQFGPSESVLKLVLILGK